MIIGLPSRHDWAVMFEETDSDLVTELGIDDARLPGAAELFPNIEPITGIRVTLHTLDDEGEGEVSVRLELSAAEEFAEALLLLIRQQKEGTDA